MTINNINGTISKCTTCIYEIKIHVQVVGINKGLLNSFSKADNS